MAITNEFIEEWIQKVPEINSTLGELKKLNVYVSDYCINNDKEDDSSGFLKMVSYINSIDEETRITIVFNTEKLFLSKIMKFTRGNIEFNIKNCKIIWNNTENIGNDKRTYGVFNFIGGVDSGYIITDFFNSKGTGATRESFSYIEVENTSIFTEGELVKLSLGENKQTNTEICPYVNVLTRITKIEGKRLYIEYSTPWDIFEVAKCNYGKVYKLTKYYKNIIIDNMNFLDITEVIKSDNTESEYPNRGNLVNLFSMMYVDNLSIKNIKGERNKFCLIRIDNGINITLENIEDLNPDIVGGGEGYGIQLNACTKIFGNNIKGTNCRHIVDVTNSNHILLVNCHGNGKQYAISQHGAYEHDITYFNCEGSFQTGQSGALFGDASKNITLINCKGSISSRYCENLILENCDMSIIGGLPHSVIYKNCKITNTFSSILPNERNIKGSYIKFIDSEFKSNISAAQWTFSNWDEVSFVRSNYTNVVDSYLNESSTSYTLILRNVKKFISDKSNTNMILFITGQDFDCSCSINETNYELVSNQALFRTYNLTNSKVVFRIKNNNIYPKANGRTILTVPDLYKVTNSSVALEFTNNYIDNKYTGHVMLMKKSSENIFQKIVFRDNFMPKEVAISNGYLTTGGENILY